MKTVAKTIRCFGNGFKIKETQTKNDENCYENSVTEAEKQEQAEILIYSS